jgi:hypothetical protein
MFENLKALSTHIQFKHNNNKKDYYDKWLKKEYEGFCKMCGKPTEFYILNYGYKVYCSDKCMSDDYIKEKTIHNPMHSKEAKQHQRETNLKRYGVTQNTMRPEIKQQIIDTNKKIYGVENVSQNASIKAKSLKNREKTNQEKYNVKSVFSVKEIMEKCHNTIKKNNMLNYGVEYAMQRHEVFEKAQKTRFTIKKFQNSNLWYQGTYEYDFLEKYFNRYPDIKRGPSIKYTFKNKNKVYHPDFFIPSLNLIVECKNSYLYKRYEENIKAKEIATINTGYNYITIIDKDYSAFNSRL